MRKGQQLDDGAGMGGISMSAKIPPACLLALGTLRVKTQTMADRRAGRASWMLVAAKIGPVKCVRDVVV